MSEENQATSPPTSTPNDSDVVLEAQNITKRFPGVLANNNVNLKLRRGEILALLGENGAGKSTLMNIIYGLYHQDEGDVLLRGQGVHFASPREAIHSGIGMVHQHFQLIDVMDVGENIVLGEERETPRWFSLFSFIFSMLLSIFAVKLILDYKDPLVFATFTFALITMLLPWFFAERLSAIGSRPFDYLIDYFSKNADQKPRQPYNRSKWQQNLMTIMQIIALIVLLVVAGNSTAFTATEVFVALFGMVIVGGLAYTLFSVLSDNAYGGYINRGVGQIVGQYIIESYVFFFSILITAAIALISTLVGWLIFSTLSDAVSISETFKFLTLLTLAIPIAATISVVFTLILFVIFEQWEIVSTGSRVVWGIVWRLSLILAALWIGGVAHRVSQMGMVTLLLQNDVPFDAEVSTNTGPVSVAFWNDGEQPPYSKGGVAGHTELSINWNARITNAGGNDEQIKAVLDLIDERFAYEATYENVTPTYRVQAHVEGLRGVNTELRDAVYDVPLLVRDLVTVFLLVLFAIIGIVSWRGIKVFPTIFHSFDLLVVAAISVVYSYLIWRAAKDLDNARIVVLGVSVLLLAFTIIYTHRKRLEYVDKVRSTSLFDTIIDTLNSLIYTIFSVRNSQQANARIQELSRQYGLEVDPTAVVEKLPVGLQQRVEIIKALYRKADILILDEPTAVLTPQEGKELFKIMRDLASQGVSIIFITHKLKEVFEVATDIVVMRNGEVVGTTRPSEATESSLAAMMVGREVLLRVEKDEAQPTGTVLHVEDLHATDDRGAVALNGVSFEVEAGEVLGIAGVQGNGQTELVEVLTGLRPMDAGGVELLGQELKPQRHPDANSSQRLIANLLDFGVLAMLTIIVSYFVSYFNNDPKAFKVLSVQSLLIFIVLDAIYTLGSWQLWGATFGKFAMSLQIVHKTDDSHPAFPSLVQRYVFQTLMRYTIIGYPVIAVIQALASTETKSSYQERLSERFRRVWYDDITTVNCRVINQIVITSRKIKDLRTGHIPEDRLRFGMVKAFSVTENLILNDYYEAPHAKSPSVLQLPLLSTSYALVMATIFAIIGYGWLRVWNSTLWGALLDSFNVPSGFRNFQAGQGLSDLQKAYIDDPLLLSLVILMVMTLLTGLVAYLLTKLIFRFIGDPYSFIPPLAVVATALVGLVIVDGISGQLSAGFNDRFFGAIASLSSSFLGQLSDFSYSTVTNRVIWGVLSLLFLVVSGVLYSWFRDATKDSPELTSLKQSLHQNRIGQFIEMQNAHGLTLNVENSVGYANRLIEEYDIRTPSALTSGGSLSGGNQQKLVVAREFSREPRLLIAAQPTRGIDVGSIEFIHRRIVEQRDKGAAVLLVSAELDEVMSLSDRIAVMYKGEVIKVVAAKDATREELGLLMAGIVQR
jgi:ABC-type uncharacterized transport system ATPase subunit